MAVTSSKRVGRNSFTMRRTNDWVMSTDVPTDIAVDVAGTTFSLHKFPLVSRCGRLRRQIAEARDPDLSALDLKDLPGGAEAFEMATKFCYGANLELTASNVATLRCVAEYLEMTDEYGQNNLVSRTEAYLEDVVMNSLGNAITVLHSCETLLPLAEELNIVSRCVETIGMKACEEQLAVALSKGTGGKKTKGPSAAQVEWWAEELSILKLDFYRRVLAVMKSQGMPQEYLWGSLMHYAQTALTGFSKSSADQETAPAMEHEQRVLVETIVNLLPAEKSSTSSSFLFGLLRTAIILDTTVACRLELERRIGLQLEDATLDDLLIPSFSYSAGTLFDTDIVQRIASNFFQSKPSQSATLKVAKLIDNYLSEVAPDSNLKLTKFISLADLLPESARMTHDGLYRALDIFFKAHPSVSDAERRKACKLLDVQRLSSDACTHAAQNERLPAHFIIQILYMEQLKLKSMLASHSEEKQHQQPPRVSTGPPATVPPRNAEQVSLRKENRELKSELNKVKTRLSDLEKDNVSDQSSPTASSATASSGKFFQTFSRRLGKLNPFGRSSLSKPPPTPEYQKPRDRRHSIS